jgi:hypothetical protein
MGAIFMMVSLATTQNYSAQAIDFSNYLRPFQPKATSNPLIHAIIRNLISGRSVTGEVLHWLPCDSHFLTTIQFYLHSTNPPGGMDVRDDPIRGTAKLCP